MQNGIIERLFASFGELEQSIRSARHTLAEKGNVSSEVLERLDSYDTILSKQRKLADSLCSHIKSQNWNEVTRHVTLINGLSAMIRDDARLILGSISLNTDKGEGDSDFGNFC